MSSNLFIAHHEAVTTLKAGDVSDQNQTKYVPWENTFTKGLLHYLRLDSGGLDAFLHLLLGDERFEHANTVAREVHFGDGIGRPDLVIELSSGRLLVIENKIHAGLGREQLERYLSIPDSGSGSPYVALISRKPQRIPDGVMNCENYLRPPDDQHFSWHVVHQRIAALEIGDLGPAAIRNDFIQYMLHTDLGWVRVGPKLSSTKRRLRAGDQASASRSIPLAPVHVEGNWHRLFLDRMECQNRSVMETFGSGWLGLDEWLKKRGLKTQGNSYSGRYATPLQSAAYRQITLSPIVTPRHLLDSRLNGALEDSVIDLRFVFNGRDCPEAASALATRFQDGVAWSDEVVWYRG